MRNRMVVTVTGLLVAISAVGVRSVEAANLSVPTERGHAETTTASPIGPQTPRETRIKFVTNAMRLAKQGFAPDMPYRSGVGVVDTIRQSWGKPSTETVAGAGMYDTYSSHQAAFGFNKGGQLFDVRSYRKDVQSITMSDVSSALGKNREVRYNGNETIWMYPAGPKYQLLWMFPNPTKSSPNPKADHISVFYPEATINSMAAEFPSPSVVLDESPGAVGDLFTFSIRNRPSGYRLEEFEWIGGHGQTVVETYEEAVRNGAVGGDMPNFEVSGDGQTLSFVYGSRMKGQNGQLQLLFQNTNGSAAVATSRTLHLK